jgi:nucleotide-binding universal stress UspA family protein
MSKVIVPLDGSDLAETALPYVEDLARALSLKIVLVRAVRIDAIYSGDTYSSPYGDGGELVGQVEAASNDYLKGVAERLSKNGLAVEWKLLRGSLARAVVNLAQATSQGMIALTTHGRSGLTRLVLGSVTEAVVKTSSDPVLVIPPK